MSKKRSKRDILEKAIPGILFQVNDDTIKIKLPKEINDVLWKWVNLDLEADWNIETWNKNDDGCLYLKKRSPEPCHSCTKRFEHLSRI